MNNPADTVAQARAEIRETAEMMLSSECSYVLGVRLTCALLKAAHLDIRTGPFSLFSAIESETDQIPIGDELAY
jgi:hypothetical protein